MNPMEAGADFLEHFGVKGMRWGVRRNKKAANSSKTTYKKPPGHLSEQELKRRIGRMELEKKYSDLNLTARSPGKAYVKNILDGQGKSVAGLIVGGTASFFLQRALKKKFGDGSAKTGAEVAKNLAKLAAKSKSFV